MVSSTSKFSASGFAVYLKMATDKTCRTCKESMKDATKKWLFIWNWLVVSTPLKIYRVSPNVDGWSSWWSSSKVAINCRKNNNIFRQSPNGCVGSRGPFFGESMWTSQPKADWNLGNIFSFWWQVKWQVKWQIFQVWSGFLVVLENFLQGNPSISGWRCWPPRTPIWTWSRTILE